MRKIELNKLSDGRDNYYQLVLIEENEYKVLLESSCAQDALAFLAGFVSTGEVSLRTKYWVGPDGS